jgi:hypothetical protein
MRTLDPSLILLFLLPALVAVFAGPADAQVSTAEAKPGLRLPMYESEATGLRVILPPGWSGSETADEERLPGRATYRWEATEGALEGSVVVIERAVGLNPLAEERWRRGQVGVGYYGLRPTAVLSQEAMVFGPGAGVEVAAGGRRGRAYFVQRGPVFWAVHVAAPERVLDADPSLLDALAGGILLSAEPTASR